MNVRKNLGIRLAVFVLMVALVVAVPAGAVTHYVSPGQSIQAAIDDANDGEQIEVAPGIYYEAINFNSKAVRLYSSGGPDVTIIDGTGNYHVVQCVSGEDANTVLYGFTIADGNANGVSWPHYHGGGMLNISSSPTVSNCKFTENSSQHWGGGMYNDQGSHTTLINCTFSGNTSDIGGGGIGNWGSSPTVTNCTFTKNSAASGGGMCNNSGSNPTVTNCILWGNIGGEIVDNSSTTTVTYSDIQGGWGGAGNIDADPCFVDAAGGDLRLSSSASPCVDAGDNSAPNLPATDLAGNPRVVDGDGDTNVVVDMGAYEFKPLTIHNITKDLWYETIQPAIDDANDGDQIEVAPGTYYEAIDFKGKAVRLYSSGGPNVTIINGTGNYHVVQCVSGEDANTVLEGFTITGGNANGTDPNDRRGGGMFNENSSPMVTNCTFTDNTATYDGGAMYNLSSSPTVTSCSFTDNSVVYSGGGMYNYQSSPTVADCTFSQNTANTAGGMVNVDGSNPTVTNCAFSDNASSSPTWGGAGMCNLVNCSPRVINCTFSGNTATYDGGGMSNYDNSTPTVTNCIFNGNSADYGGGMYNDASNPAVTNCTFSSNSASNGSGMCNYTNSSPTVTNCTFTDNANVGMYNNGSSPTVTDCTFTGNSSSYGGGMANHESSPTVTNCKFTANTATMNAGGMYNYNSHPTVTNCTFTGNTASSGTHGGAGMWNHGSSPTVTNCTFTGNTATTNGGGMYNYTNSYPTVTNCILWGNTPDEIFNSGGIATVTYSDVKGGYSGTGNINADPCFADAAGGDLRLSSSISPCVDAGDNSAPSLPATDLAGNGRLFDGDGDGSTIVDMGAYEFGSIKLLAHWRLDESSGVTAYDSSSDNHGALEPGPAVWQAASGRIGGALEFDGLNDFVSIPNESNFDITERLTIAAWIKVNAFDRSWQAIVTKGDYAWRIQRDAENNALEFAVSGTSAGNILGSVNVNDGQWHHAAGVYDGTMIYLYVDGAVDNSVSASGTISTNDYPVMIGENAEQLGRFWNGLIDDVAIFSRALDGSEITNLKNNGGASFLADPNLKALWELDESSGTTASDSAGGNHGTLEPAPAPPLWQPDGGRLGGALEFDGVDDFVSIPNESRFDITYQLTVSAWIQVAAFDKDWQAIVTKGDAAWRLHRLRDTNSVTFHCNNSPYWGADGNIGVDDGQWHHVAGVYDGTRAYLYVDGVLDNSEPAFGLISKNDFPVMIGENAERSGRCWNGLIDDVRIYTSALSPSEVYMLYSNICYVDADANGLNDGTSWENAYNYLQDALAAQATSGWEIRVAEGTYKPDVTSGNPSGTGDRTATFELINGVILIGGYAGFGQPDTNVRDCDLYETTLSGDINTPGDANDNSYHIVTSSECDLNTILDGFTITGGNANGTDSDVHGGGMYNNGSNPTVTNCTFIGNTADNRGGGMYNNEGSSPKVTDCTFSSNSAGNQAGGMYNNNSNSTVTSCIFTGNSSAAGGGMFNGGGSPAVTNCIFSDNSAGYGAGMWNYGSSPTVTNCTFSTNAGSVGGGMYNEAGSDATVTNCIFWGDTLNEIINSASSPTVTYSNVQGGYSGTGNIDTDPLFVDAAGGNLRLRPGSPCVDQGSNAAVPSGITTDLDGRPRIIDGDCDEIDVVDMGAYEFALAYFGDFDNNCSVNFFDVSIFARSWETEEGDPDWDWACDISYPPDDYIDWRDAAVLCDNWLATP